MVKTDELIDCRNEEVCIGSNNSIPASTIIRITNNKLLTVILIILSNDLGRFTYCRSGISNHNHY